MTKDEIKALRKRLGETREQFGARFGKGISAVKHWEAPARGKWKARMPSEDVLKQMAQLATSLESAAAAAQ